MKKLRYKLQVETKYSLFYLKKEYSRPSDVLKAVRMIDWDRYRGCVVTVCVFHKEIHIMTSEAIPFPFHARVSECINVA